MIKFKQKIYVAPMIAAVGGPLGLGMMGGGAVLSGVQGHQLLLADGRSVLHHHGRAHGLGRHQRKADRAGELPLRLDARRSRAGQRLGQLLLWRNLRLRGGRYGVARLHSDSHHGGSRL